MIKRALIFVASMAVVAGIAWVGGYDFDRRGPDAKNGVPLWFIIIFSILDPAHRAGHHPRG